MEMVGVNNKRQIMAVFVALSWVIFCLYNEFTRARPITVTHSFLFHQTGTSLTPPKHGSTEEAMLQYIQHIIVPHVEKVRRECW